MAQPNGNGRWQEEGSRGRYRRPDEIEREIGDTRLRMERTLAELERRFRREKGPGGSAAGPGFGGFAWQEVEHTAQPILDALRRNPLPAVLIGAGLIWLATEIALGRGRRSTLDLHATHLDGSARRLVGGLIGAARQSTRTLRMAAERVAPGANAAVLRQAAEERGRTAALLQAELRHLGGETLHGDAPTGDVLPGWRHLSERLESGLEGQSLLSALVQADRETVDRFREALRRPLPDDLRIVVGARFYDVERTHGRLATLLEGTTRSGDPEAQASAA